MMSGISEDPQTFWCEVMFSGETILMHVIHAKSAPRSGASQTSPLLHEIISLVAMTCDMRLSIVHWFDSVDVASTW